MANIQLKDNEGILLYPKTLWGLVSGAPEILQELNIISPSTINVLSEKAVMDALRSITADSLGAATTTYVDNKVDSITPDSIGALKKVGSGTYGRVYGITSGGDQITRDCRDAAAEGSLPIRNANGTFQIGEPKANTNPATKKYVDSAVAAITPATIGAATPADVESAILAALGAAEAALSEV